MALMCLLKVWSESIKWVFVFKALKSSWAVTSNLSSLFLNKNNLSFYWGLIASSYLFALDLSVVTVESSAAFIVTSSHEWRLDYHIRKGKSDTLFLVKWISVYHHSSPAAWSWSAKSRHILSQSIFNDLTLKWRPEEYIACLSLCRPCLQQSRAERLWDNARLKLEEKRSSQAFPTAFDQQHLIQEQGPLGRRPFGCQEAPEWKLSSHSTISIIVCFPTGLKKLRCPLLVHIRTCMWW